MTFRGFPSLSPQHKRKARITLSNCCYRSMLAHYGRIHLLQTLLAALAIVRF